MTTTDDDARTRELLKAELEEEIRRLITVGATEGALIAVVAYLAGEFPDMTTAELSAAMQDAMARRSGRAPGGITVRTLYAHQARRRRDLRS